MIAKRVFDFIMAFIGLVLISPLFLIVSLINKIVAKEVFFIQERIGKNSKPFNMIKFATMVKDAHIVGSTITYSDDPRVTRIGAFLRSTKINELPQLINVLKGDMSFVGPRPLPAKELEIYDPEIAKKIYSIKPGITGFGSLYFFNEEKLLPKDMKVAEDCFRNLIIPRKSELELWYVENRNFLFDLKVIIATLSLVIVPSDFVLSFIGRRLSGSGISQNIDEIMEMQQNAKNEP
jgi:lipopolysaccharide/colanic/teichoic acid biosynthesis glycosyltransferase